MDDFTKLLVSVVDNGIASEFHLRYDEKGPVLSNPDDVFVKETIGIERLLVHDEVVIDSSGIRKRKSFASPVEICFQPLLSAERGYMLDRSRPDHLYPPSSAGWYTRIERRGRKSSIFLHSAADEKKYWLSIVDNQTGEFLEAHTILPFEKGVLEIADETEEYSEMFLALSEVSESAAIEWMDRILDGPPPTWSELAKITGDVYIPNLKIGNRMRDTVDQLVPKNYDSQTRLQVMAFLGAIVKGHNPGEDPVDYFERLQSTQVLRALLMGHLSCILSGGEPPSYVRIIQDGARQRLGVPTRTVTDSLDSDTWYHTYYRILDRFPLTYDTVLEYSARMNNSNRIVLGLPVTKSQAARSRKNWVNRLDLMGIGVMLRALLRPPAIGLKRIVYMGFAHKWPTIHMKWSSNIGSEGYREPSIQILEMPPDSVEASLRARPNLLTVDWTGASVNEQLYDAGSKTWRVPISRIASSMQGKRTLRRLGNEFGAWRGSRTRKPTHLWAKALDATANLKFLANLEQDKYVEYMGLTRSELLHALQEMKEIGIITVAYVPNVLDLMTLAVIAQGKAANVCSLSRAFLKYSPTATVHLAKDGEWLLALTRQPISTAHHLMAILPEEAARHGITLRCNRTTSFRSYQGRFYTRMLREDGTWETDISPMLSQIRVPFQDEN